MMRHFRNGIWPSVTITPASLESIGGAGVTNTVPASTAYPSANLALFVPFRLWRPYYMLNAFIANGASVSGNVDVGIYSADGTKIVSTGSKAHAGTSAIQSFSLASEFGPGLFYMAIAMDNNTGTLLANAALQQVHRLSGILQMAAAFPLPATATFAALTTSYLPIFGITKRSFV